MDRFLYDSNLRHERVNRLNVKKNCDSAILKLQYYVNLRANFNLSKFENLSIRFERHSIINIQ